MKLWQFLCLIGFGFLLIAQLPLVETEADEEFEEDSDDSYMESERDELVVSRERPVYTRPILSGRAHFAEPFDTRAEYLRRWVPSQAKKDGVDDSVAKYDGKWEVEEPKDNPITNDLGLVLKSKAKHHAVSAKLDRPYHFSGKPFIAQYEVKFQNGQDCGGAYIKLLSADNLNLKTFTDKSPYTIMFGPDKCGNDHKLHFIFRHKNPKTGEYEEKHSQKTTAKLDSYFSDRNTHLYTLIVNPDNSYEVKVDNNLVSSGDLLNNVSPPVNPPKEIDDPADKKPSEWDDREKIPDPDATKPEDWDESEPTTIVDESAEMPDGWLEDEETYVADPEAVKPDDWDDEMDGEWEAPKIDNPECANAPGCGKWEKPTMPNPNYKGKWKAPMIDNPEYKGEWKPRRINNPDYFEDLQPYKMTPIQAIGLELWSMTDDILFDNFFISDNLTLVDEFTALTWEVKNVEEKAASSTGQSIVQAIKDATNERPWLWAVFILVVVLPIILIITYCCSTGGTSKGWWQAIKSTTENRPWLWAAYAMLILLPIMFLSICFCPNSGPVKPDDIDAHRKKFDDPSPDDEEGVEKEGEGEGEIDEGATGDREQENDKEMEEAEEVGAAGDGGSDQDGEENEDAGADASSKKSNSPRKRRARKE